MRWYNTTKYILNVITYLEKGTVPKQKSVADFFVEKLIAKTISGMNLSVTVDNWFTNVALAKHLLKKCKITTFGTVKKTN